MFAAAFGNGMMMTMALMVGMILKVVHFYIFFDSDAESIGYIL